MEIFAIQGHKVIFDNPDSGLMSDQIKAKEHLTVGSIYTVLETIVGRSSSVVMLEEVKGQEFNTVMFSDVEPQNVEDTESHEDWVMFNSDGPTLTRR